MATYYKYPNNLPDLEIGTKSAPPILPEVSCACSEENYSTIQFEPLPSGEIPVADVQQITFSGDVTRLDDSLTRLMYYRNSIAVALPLLVRDSFDYIVFADFLDNIGLSLSASGNRHIWEAQIRFHSDTVDFNFRVGLRPNSNGIVEFTPENVGLLIEAIRVSSVPVPDLWPIDIIPKDSYYNDDVVRKTLITRFPYSTKNCFGAETGPSYWSGKEKQSIRIYNGISSYVVGCGKDFYCVLLPYVGDRKRVIELFELNLAANSTNLGKLSPEAKADYVRCTYLQTLREIEAQTLELTN